MRISRTRRLVGILLLCSATQAAAQTLPLPRSYAVFSEVARDVSVVIFQESTGSRLGGNQRHRIDIPQGTLDTLAVLTAKKSIESAAPGSRVWLIAPVDGDLFPRLQNPVVGSTLAIPEDLAAALKQKGSTHLLLLTRHRDDAEFTAQNAHIGDGQLEGLGFYLDRQTATIRSDTLESATGYFAYYVYFRATLADATSGQVLRTQAVKATQAYSAAHAKDSRNPWDVMSNAEKLKVLRVAFTEQIDKVIPALIESR
ncbi:MAG: hypothetical protein Q7S90_09130 [Rubrivivax sp.]|nr:hypothetical protein [Rubrivivax sp.]